MERLRVLVHGALGRIGQEVLRTLCRDPELQAVAGVDLVATERDLPLPDGSGSIPLSADLERTIARSKPHVLVDFTTAEATMPAVRTGAKHNVRLVIGTTGLTSANLEEIGRICHERRIGAVVATNFSVAAAVMIHLAGTAARFFDYAEIIEMHHEQKIDAPSGTALTTAREMAKSRGKAFRHTSASKEPIPGTRGGELDGIALHSVRLPGLLAHQEVILGAQGQTLKIRLDQISREAFMPGVTMAIKKVMELEEAVFGLDRILGLEE